MDSQAGRAALDKCFVSFVAVDSGLAAVASIVADLNAFSTRKVEEPDFDRRFAAFSDISERRYGELSPEEWIPVLRNLVSSVRHEKEFSMRTNAAFCLVKLVDRASETVQEGGDTAFRDLVVFVLLPAIKASMERGSEAVRNEFLGLLSHIVKRMADDPVFEGMRCLVEGRPMPSPSQLSGPAWTSSTPTPRRPSSNPSTPRRRPRSPPTPSPSRTASRRPQRPPETSPPKPRPRGCSAATRCTTPGRPRRRRPRGSRTSSPPDCTAPSARARTPPPTSTA